jgi:hypothetical protein
MEEVDNVLAHYGVKGMRWGRRKRDRDDVDVSGGSKEPQDVTIKSSPGKPIKVSGGKNHPASEDAKRAAAYRQKAKASSLNSLTNQEIKVLVERMKLEKSYAEAMAANNQKSAGKKFVADLLESERKSFVSGKKGPLTAAVAMMFTASKSHMAGRAARAATQKAAQRAATKAISGVIINR